MDFVILSIFDNSYLLSDNPSCDRMSIACGAIALMDWLSINPWCGHNTCSLIYMVALAYLRNRSFDWTNYIQPKYLNTNFPP